MEQINVLIIEDDLQEGERLSDVLEKHNYAVTGIARNYAEALKLFYEHQPDLVVIDVYLDGRPEGINFAETLCATPNALRPFVFLTSSKDREIFERARLTSPFSFLLKPFNELEVVYAIEMAVEKFYSQHSGLSGGNDSAVVAPDYLFIKKKKSLKKTPVSDILYVEVEGRYCNIFTAKERFVVLISLAKISTLLGNGRFLRTHRNYLVNSDKIREINPEDSSLILEDGHMIALSENYRNILAGFPVLK